MNKLVLALLIMSSAAFGADLDISCKTSYGNEPEQIRVIKENGSYSILFDNKEVDGLNCIGGNEFNDRLVRCTSHNGGLTLDIETAAEVYGDGVLIKKGWFSKKMPLICFDLTELDL